jgi:hypothetical protein
METERDDDTAMRNLVREYCIRGIHHPMKQYNIFATAHQHLRSKDRYRPTQG